MNKRIFSISLFCGLISLFILQSCIISDPQPENCETAVIAINTVTEGASNDIVLTDVAGNTYYINRGLEQGLSLTELQRELSNKMATLHLPKMIYGTSRHIAQLTVDTTVIYSEFN